MSKQTMRTHAVLLGLVLGLLVSLPAFAGSAVVGSVAGNTNATLSGEPILPNSTILSGDSLQVKNGVAIVAISNGGRLTFGRESSVMFMRDADEITAVLGRGNATLYHPAESGDLVIRAGDVTVSPAPGFLTAGVVAMAGGTVVVTSQEGTLRVKANGRVMDVGRGKSLSLGAKSAQPAGAPQGGGSSWGGSPLTWLTLGASATGAILAGIAISDANSAKSDALAAESAAGAAASAAAAAESAALAAGSAANAVGCALDVFGQKNDPGAQVTASFYTPPSGYTCP